MRAQNYGLLFLLVALPSAMVFAEDKDNDTVGERLQGRWEIVAGTNQGRELSNEEVEGTYVTVTTNRIVTYDRSQRQLYQAVFRIDETKSPAHITMTTVATHEPTNQPGKSDTPTNPSAAGILRFDGSNQWTLCYALPGTDRPKEFNSPPDSKIMLFRLERKPGDPTPDSITAPESK